MKAAGNSILASNAYATLVVGFAIVTDCVIYTVVLPFLPDLFAGRLHVPRNQISRWSASAFEVYAVATLLSSAVTGLLPEMSGSSSRSFLVCCIIMVISTITFFLGTTPVMIVVSRAIQGVSTTCTWVLGIAFLVEQVGEGELGVYVGWTTVGVPVGEIVGPLVGGLVYDYLGYWAVFGIVEALLLIDILLRLLAKEKKKPGIDTKTQEEEDTEAGTDQDPETDQDSGTDRLLPNGQEHSADYNTMDDNAKGKTSDRSLMRSLAWDWLGTVIALTIIFMVRGALEVAVPLYLSRQYSWTPSRISLTLLTITLPAAANPLIGGLTSRQGPRWWSTGAFVVCGATMIGFGSVAGDSEKAKFLFIVLSAMVGVALAVLINSNQVAISVASQRYGLAKTRAKDRGEDLGRILFKLSPSTMLSGVTTSWSAGILLGPAYSNLMPYTTDAGWAIFCHGLGGICLVAAAGNLFLWRKW